MIENHNFYEAPLFLVKKETCFLEKKKDKKYFYFEQNLSQRNLAKMVDKLCGVRYTNITLE